MGGRIRQLVWGTVSPQRGGESRGGILASGSADFLHRTLSGTESRATFDWRELEAKDCCLSMSWRWHASRSFGVCGKGPVCGAAGFKLDNGSHARGPCARWALFCPSRVVSASDKKTGLIG